MEPQFCSWSVLRHCIPSWGREWFSRYLDDGIEHVLVRRASDRRPREGVRYHMSPKYIPATFLNTHYLNGVNCTSVAFAYMQVLADLSFYEGLFLGLSLCSKPVYEAGKGALDLGTLKELICSGRRMRGMTYAQKVAPYLKAGGNSAMELLMYAYLCLPTKHGGMGLPCKGFSIHVKLDEEEKSLMKRNYIEVDLYLGSRTCLEYESFQHHNNSRSFALDRIRSDVLARKGIKMIPVTSIHVNDLSGFELLINTIEQSIGYRLRIRSKKFRTQFVALHNFGRMSPLHPWRFTQFFDHLGNRLWH